MKTSEFIEKALDFKDIDEHEKLNGSILFYENQASLIATVSEKAPMEMSTHYFRFGGMEKYSKLEFLTLLYEYAKTPIEEREEPKKYKLRHKLVKDSYLNYYLGYIKDENELRFSNSHETGSFKTAFTIQEWETLTEQTWEDLLLQFNAIEV